jgi:hypothetical protein
MGKLFIDLFSFISQKPKKYIELDKNLMTLHLKDMNYMGVVYLIWQIL